MKITWYGHSCFRLDMDGASVLIDPFITGNPVCPVDRATAAKGVSHVIVSHGHDDHLGDCVAIAKETGATLTANYEICMWAAAQGVEKINPMNSGGTVDLGAFAVSLTVAHHSSASTAGGGAAVYLGNPHGIVITPKQGKPLYHAGDTDIFGDMALIAEIYRPKIGILPIGDRFTMGGKTAAMAARRFFDFDLVIPCHFRTFGLLDQDTSKFFAGMVGAPTTRVVVLEPGGSVEG
jgi:L-ascorbate metabolism protein UlaG (beta-lactamase superfamily)